MKRSFLKNICIFAIGLGIVGFYMPRLCAEDKPLTGDVIDMITGDIQTVAAHNLTRVSVTNPDVADISDAQSDKISLLAKRAGSTTLFLWDAAGKRRIKVRVVNEDLRALKLRVEKVLEEAGITGVSFEENLDVGKLVVSGDLAKDDKTRLNDVLEPYSENLLNLVKEEKREDLIEVDMQVIEISTTLEQNLGILWGNNTTGTTAATYSSTGTPSTGTTSNSGAVALNYTENAIPTGGNKFANLFKIGSFSRGTGLEATVNALLQEGKARLISKPRLVVISGKQASFLVGGEIPIQSTTTSQSGGVQQSNTTYTQYGVNMTVTPTIRKEKIDVLMNVDIRDVDNSSSFSTNSNVAFITRTASTELLMDNKQTIVLAGLIKYQDSVTLTEVPFLSKIPIVGLLFRNRNQPADSSTEMVIILTPVVLTEKKIAEKQIVMPTPSERDANNEINAKYEHEPLPAWPVVVKPAEIVNPAPAVNPVPVVKPVPAVNSVPVVSPAPEEPKPLPSVVPDNDLQSVLPEMTAYARMVQERISNAVLYPQEARSRELSGTVKLKLRILRDGTLSSVEVMNSSGNDILDQEAILAAKTAAPYDAFTTGMKQKELIFTIPIVYNKLIPGAKASSEKVIASY
jgi:pilus assembly protein CpaC